MYLKNGQKAPVFLDDKQLLRSSLEYLACDITRSWANFENMMAILNASRCDNPFVDVLVEKKIL